MGVFGSKLDLVGTFERSKLKICFKIIGGGGEIKQIKIC